MTIDRSSYDQRCHNAARFAEQIIQRAKHLQEAQHPLADHPVHGPTIESIALDGMDCCNVAQQFIREAEDYLGDRVPLKVAVQQR